MYHQDPIAHFLPFFCFEVYLTYNIIQACNIVIWYLYRLYSIKSCKILAIFPVLLSWPWLSTVAKGQIRAQVSSILSLVSALALAMAVSALRKSRARAGVSGPRVQGGLGCMLGPSWQAVQSTR